MSKLASVIDGSTISSSQRRRVLAALILSAVALTIAMLSPRLANATAAVTRASDPFGRAAKLYVDPSSRAAVQARQWRTSRPAEARRIDLIAKRPVATWLGDWNNQVGDDAASLARRARRAGAVPVVVAYNIPQRDCGSYSAGGAHSAAAYAKWISALAGGLARGPAAVILEPDAIAGWDCLDEAGRARRAAMLRGAVATLSRRGISVYLDGGNSNWKSPATMATRLRSSGLGKARGVAVNVSNFRTTSESLRYVRALRSKLPGMRAVIDTSRNGQGPAADQWCNPAGRGLGLAPTVSPGLEPLDALLWIKAPGESDGTCNGGPAAGEWWPEQALGLAMRAAR